MKKILVLHTSVGYGPKVVAENIASYLQENSDWEVRILDATKRGSHKTVQHTAGFYLKIVEQFSFLWRWLYHTKLVHNSFIYRFRYLMAWKGKRVIEVIKEFSPDLIISTQTFPSAVAAYAKRKNLWSGRLAIVFSDYHFQPFWVYPEADLFFCVTETERQALLRDGWSSEKINVVGIPIARKFFSSFDQTAAKRELGIPDDDLPIITVTGGRRALIASERVVKSLLDLQLPIRIIVLCGKNQELLAKMSELRQQQSRSDFEVFGFISNMEKLLAITDILISKPGGPTISEAAAQGVLVIVTDVHGGHEEENFKFLTSHNFVVGALKTDLVAEAVKSLLSDRESMKKYQKRLKKLVSEDSLSEIKAAISRELSVD